MSYSHSLDHSPYSLERLLGTSTEVTKEIGSRIINLLHLIRHRRTESVGGVALMAASTNQEEPPIEDVKGMSNREAIRLRGAQAAEENEATRRAKEDSEVARQKRKYGISSVTRKKT